MRYAVYSIRHTEVHMARRPKYGRVIKPVTFRPSPENEEKLNSAIESTGRTLTEITDEVLTIGFPVWLRKNSPKKAATAPTASRSAL
jgi:hypothetical protein